MVALHPHQKMEKNLVRAIDERARLHDSALMTPEEYSRFAEAKPIGSIWIETFEKKGKRPSMQDASFALQIDENALLGVFDGHGSDLVAQFAAQFFKQHFKEELTSCKGSVHTAFMRLFPAVQDCFVRSGISAGGTTALVIYLETQEQKVYTATLGDSEAYLYRKIDSKFKSLPLSCVRTWGSPKDAKRLADAVGWPQLAQEYMRTENPKSIRYFVQKGERESGLNVARAIGDIEFLYRNCKPVVIQKPKITVASYRAGDVILMGSDGVWDHMRQAEAIRDIESLKPNERLADKVGKSALIRSADNVSVVSMKFIACPLCCPPIPLPSS